MASPVRTVRGGIIPVRLHRDKSTPKSTDDVTLPRFHAACFDLDGTLIDTTPLHLAAEAETLRDFGIDFDDPRRPWTFGLGDDACAKLIADAFGLKADRVLEAYVPRWWAQVAAGAELKQGAREILGQLAELNVPMALVTSGDAGYVRLMFESCGIGQFFKATVSMDDVQQMKPHPEPYLLAAAQLGIDPQRCVGFEDSPAGLESLRSAGMYSLAVVDDGNTRGADLVVGGLDRVDGNMLREWFS